MAKSQSNTDILTYAFLSQDSYSNTKTDYLPKEWEILTSTHPESGYDATAYRNIVTNEIVIAHRGTEPSAGDGDLSTDFKLGVLGVFIPMRPQQTDDALTFTKKIMQEYKTSSVTHTGHSLGGWLGEMTARTLGQNAITFDAPAFRPFNTIDTDIRALINKNTTKSNVTYVLSEQDVINLGTHSGTPIYLAKYIDFKFDILKTHDLHSTILPALIKYYKDQGIDVTKYETVVNQVLANEQKVIDAKAKIDAENKLLQAATNKANSQYKDQQDAAALYFQKHGTWPTQVNTNIISQTTIGNPTSQVHNADPLSRNELGLIDVTKDRIVAIPLPFDPSASTKAADVSSKVSDILPFTAGFTAINAATLATRSVLPTTTNKVIPTTKPPITTQKPTVKPPITTQKPTVKPPITTQKPTVKPPITTQKPTVKPPITTQKPTTKPPITTQKPTIKPPITTQKPTTKPPITTQKPTIKPPITTQKPTTKPPITTQKPTIKPPITTQKPTTKPPITTQKPTTKPPITTQKPTTKPPTTTQKPTTKPPTTTQRPTTKPPITTQRPTTKPPTTTQRPTTKPPTTTQRPTTKPPTTTQRPTTQPPTTQRPTTKPPTTTQKPTTKKR
jgi:hypothetical protein